MGQIAEMMLDGTLCASCGVYVGRADGFPRLCPECRSDEPEDSEALKRRKPKAAMRE